MSVAVLRQVGQTVTTPLTLHCHALAGATFDLNDATWVTICLDTDTPIWVVLLDVASTFVVLEQDIAMAPIALSAGLTFRFNALRASLFTVSMTGTIIDRATPHRFEGAILGVFSRKPSMKRAVRVIGRAGPTIGAMPPAP